MEGFIKKKDNETIFWKHWNDFIAEHQAGPRYMQSAIENFLEMSASREYLKSDESVLLFGSGRVIGIAFLPIEEKNGVKSISFCARHTMAPLWTTDRSRKELFSHIDALAQSAGVQKIMFGIDPLLFEAYPYNFLLAHEYFDTSLLTHLIDLTLPGNLLKHCRRGHSSDIKTVLNDPLFEHFSVDKNNQDYELHEGYRELHRIDAGRVTRSKASFDSQFKKLQEGNAVLFGVRYCGKIIAYAYFEMFGDKSIYASAASSPSMTHLPLYHVLMWNAMEYFQKHAVRFIDVGQPASPSAQFGYYPDQKMKNIARFKRGFGGRFTNEFSGVRYFDEQLFITETNEFRDTYAAVIKQTHYVSNE